MSSMTVPIMEEEEVPEAATFDAFLLVMANPTPRW
jgi:hypothetical protein